MNFGQWAGLAIGGIATWGLIDPDRFRGSSRVGHAPMSRRTTRILSGATLGLAAYGFVKSTPPVGVPSIQSPAPTLPPPTGTLMTPWPGTVNSYPISPNHRYLIQPMTIQETNTLSSLLLYERVESADGTRAVIYAGSSANGLFDLPTDKSMYDLGPA